MPAPDYSWLVPADVADQLGTPGQPLTGAGERARLAAGAYVERNRADLAAAYAAGAVPADVLAGAALLAARIHARKGSPTGLASFAEFGPAAVLRLDPDVERLLGLGRYGKPRVG